MALPDIMSDGAQPRSICFATICKQLQSTTSSSDAVLASLSKTANWNEKEQKTFFSVAARLLLNADSTWVDEVAGIVSPLLLHILECAGQEAESQHSGNEQSQHVSICIMLGKLVRSHPIALQFATKYFSTHKAPFETYAQEESEPAAKRQKTTVKTSSLSLKKKLVQACFNFVLASSSFASQWCWMTFQRKFFSDKDPEIKWLACQCLALVSGMTELQREKYVLQHVDLDSHRKFTLQYLLKTEKSLPSLESIDFELDTSAAREVSFSRRVVNVEGILLPRADEENVKVSDSNPCPLVYVQSTKNSLKNLALAVSSGSAVLLAAPVGSGKTSIVEHLAGLTGRTVHNRGLLKVQLSDQTDSRTLVGTYQSTDVPGEFIWTPGILTTAVQEGHWLLLEDIDYAQMDVVSLLLPLLESRTLNVPGHGDVIQANSTFQLFATQRTVSQEDGRIAIRATASSVLDQLWVRVSLDCLSRDEMRQIIEVRHPELRLIADRVLDVYFLLSTGKIDDEQVVEVRRNRATDRSISPRDLFKWCRRMSTMFAKDSSILETSSQLYVFQDALDCFLAAVMEPEIRVRLAECIGAKLNLLKQKVEFYERSYKPSLNTAEDKFQVGRVTLSKYQESSSRMKKSPTFSWTRPSSVLLERLAVCVKQSEPVLLVGETGTGKTSTIQYLAQQLGRRLIVINLNQQSDSADLLGGYKPVDLKAKVAPLREEFEMLFCQSFSRAQNAKFLAHIATCFGNRRWEDLLKLMSHSLNAAIQRFDRDDDIKTKWEVLAYKLQQLRVQLTHSDNVLAFSFVEGSLVKALKSGDWVLLDEINLATAETLECLSGILESQEGSVYLFDRGDRQPVARNPDFRLFAAMNPATDVGKKQLPQGLRSRFTEFFVDEITASADLTTLVGDYLRELSLTTAQLEGIVRFYLHIRNEALKTLTDGTGHKPHFSLRTLCRALAISSLNPCGVVMRSLYEAFCLSFLTQLDRKSHPIVEDLVVKFIVGKKNIKSILGSKLGVPRPLWSGQKADEFVEVSGYWIPRGDLEPQQSESYIVTQSVSKNLRDLSRVVSIGRLPILLQGETSVGKTSLIGYLAQLTGNKCLRVNNHEHTDLQEYVGSYTADETGKLIFKEGVLVTAMRRGYWVILDELNLAPSEVLEALNRVLDDNRELFITETQETVKAHPRFLLFATQNPPGGHYGGRKMLSRAFRNRFVELHFDEIPPDELETILHRRCAMPPSYCKKLVAVLQELQLRRRGSAAFAGKQGFMTLRDLFRWAERYRKAADVSQGVYYDWEQHLADEGYLVIAGRVRKEEEVAVICEVLEKHFKRKVASSKLFTLSEETSPVTRPLLEAIYQHQVKEFQHLVWTYSLRRLVVLVGQALKFQEPVLMVGDTGCGKTSVCQWLAAHMQRQLFTVNCHQYSEGADFLGGLRPVRDRTSEHDDKDRFDRLFEWVDGPLVTAMKQGHFFLADEISLADDSVLERLNSVLEPERSLLLAEKAAGQEPELITAEDEFRFFGTMNPGGDFGKKELSPALRNRLTEIWCPMSRDRRDIVDIVEHNLLPGLRLGDKPDIGETMMDFIDWFGRSELGARITISVRDVLSWVQFINTATQKTALDAGLSYIHGACLVFLDALGNARDTVDNAIRFLTAQVQARTDTLPDVSAILTGMSSQTRVVSDESRFGIAPFFISKGGSSRKQSNLFTFRAPSTSINVVRLLRSLQLNKPLLLEGSPGVGKTSLVAALAEAAGFDLVRINLSEQTDVSDLFGADLPVEGSDLGGQFEWRDGPLLRALKAGSWVVLDELNLASQSVLEGLNAVLDHRGELYIPELGKRFHLQGNSTKIFACQNPLRQGGARKGLPKSFLNRFTQVYVEPLESEDLEFIASTVFPAIGEETVKKMVQFNERLVKEILTEGLWGLRGGPWELNLRDIFRWCEALSKSGERNPGRFVQLIYADRMRTKEDKDRVLRVYREVFEPELPLPRRDALVYTSDTFIQIGNAVLPRGAYNNPLTLSESYSALGKELCVLHRNLEPLNSLAHCVNFKWMAILVGGKASGKTSLVRLLAQLGGQPLDVLTMNSAMDTTELLGGFEQGDLNRTLEEIASSVDGLSQWSLRSALSEAKDMDLVSCISALRLDYRRLAADFTLRSLVEDTEHFLRKAKVLEETLEKLGHFASSRNMAVAEKVDDLQKGLGKIVGLAKSAGTVSGGGRFEWIDSLLVKALRQGRWLLIENVNLCSPSVLDRLNGLLEPNGILTLNERGIINGEIPTIIPHPNFRLFLTLDPRFGEMSRAMRNRGVEIFLLDPHEDDLDDHDLVSALQCSGLTSGPMQRALMSVHESLVNSLPLSERPILTDLLRAASLTAQRLERLFDCPIKALMDTCREVYVKSLRDAGSRSSAQAVVSQLLETAGWREQFVVPYAPIGARQVQLCSVLAGVKQSAALIQRLVKSAQSLPFVVQDAGAVWGHALLLFYLSASPNDLELRFNYMQHLLSSSQQTDSIASVLNEELFRQSLAVMKTLENRRKDLPSDPRWMSQLCRLQLGFDIDDNNDGTASLNRVSAYLWWRCKKVLHGAASKVTQPRTVKAFSSAISNGSLAKEAAPHPVLVSLPAFITKLDETIEQLFTGARTRFDNDVWAAIIEALWWRFQIDDIDDLPVTKREMEETVAQIAQYWTWLTKKTVKVIGELESQIGGSPTDATKVNKDLAINADDRCTLARRLRRHLEMPEPFVGSVEAARFALSAAITAIQDLSVFATDSGQNFVRQLGTVDSESRVREIEAQMVSLHQAEAMHHAAVSSRLWPLMDHLMTLRYLASLAGPSETISHDEMPLTLTGQLFSVAFPQNQGLFHFWDITQAVSSARCALQWLQVEEGSNPGFLLWRSPLITLSSLIIADQRNNQQQSGVSLGLRTEASKLLNDLKVILWHNCDSLHSHWSDPIHNDYLLAVKTLKDLIRAICASLRIDLPQADDLKNLTESLAFVGVPLDAIQLINAAWQRSEFPFQTGSLWLFIGLLRCFLLAPLDNIDSVEKRKRKIVLQTRRMADIESLVAVFWAGKNMQVGSADPECQHPHLRHFNQRQVQLKELLEEDAKRKPTWRPEASLYSSIRKDLTHYSSTVASIPSVLGLHKKLEQRPNAGDTDLVISEAELWLSAQRSFYRTLKAKYSAYPDLIIPVLVAISEMCHGVEVMIAQMKQISCKDRLPVSVGQSPDDFLGDLFDFPSRRIASEDSGLLAIAEMSMSNDVQTVTDIVLDDTEKSAAWKQFLKASMMDVLRYVTTSGRIDPQAWSIFSRVVSELVAAWNAAEERKRLLQQEEDSLFKHKTKIHEGEATDAELDEKAISEYFPSYEADFDDGKVETAMEVDSDVDAVDFDEEDVVFVSQTHVTLLSGYSRSLTFSALEMKPLTERIDGSNGFHLRYRYLRSMAEGLLHAVGPQFDRRLITSQIYVLNSLLSLSAGHQNASRDSFDFYKDPCVHEAEQCTPVLQNLKRRVEELLDEWPGHATLEDVAKLCRRILSFSVDSPLMKLVTGLEMLLSKSQEWEMNAHRGVSVAEHLEALSALILRWRSVELDSWKSCLDNVEKRIRASTGKLWFHLYSSIESYLHSGDKDADRDGLQKSLRQFMESSSVGEYDSRLAILWSFMAHVQLETESGNKETLLPLLWHTTLFYGQFLEAVTRRRAALRQPVEKKVRDFVKIMRWNDINYFALREAVSKAHHTLRKFMKEYETSLEQSVKSAWTDSEQETGQIHISPASCIDVQSFVSRESVPELPVPHPGGDSNILTRLPTLCRKSQSLSLKALKSCPVANRISVVDGLVGQILGTVEDLQKHQVIGGPGADKEKQKSQAKLINHRKRQALSELFRLLQKLGLSYRKGSALCKDPSASNLLNKILPIMDVSASMESLPARPSRETLKVMWSKGPLYFSRSLARLAVLFKSLEKPSSELGPANVERCKGFAAHFMQVIQDQWSKSSGTLDKLTQLRLLLTQMKNAAGESSSVPESSVVKTSFEDLWRLIVDGLVLMEDLLQVLKAKPDAQLIDGACLVRLASQESDGMAEKAEPVLVKIQSTLSNLRAQMDDKFQLSLLAKQDSWVYGTDQWDCILEAYLEFQKIRTDLELLAEATGSQGLLETVSLYAKKIARVSARFDENLVRTEKSSEKLTADDCETICTSLLQRIQSFYKKYGELPAKATGSEEDEADDEEEIDQNFLTSSIIEQLESDTKEILKLESVIRTLAVISTCTSGKSSAKVSHLLAQAVPIVDQYVALVEYYLTLQLATLRTCCKLHSVLLNIFNELVLKGFCLPTELQEGEKQGNSQFEEIESGGLGEGEGAKDVSDQIENEDQLEDARRNGEQDEEEKNQGPGPKEEENGIEMSDDFDADLQDRDQGDENEDDEDKDENEDEDHDKQMGDLEGEGESLEEKLWGSDEEEDEDEEGDEKEDKDAKGDGRRGEKELTAKEGDKENDESEEESGNGDEKKKEKRKDINEMDEENVNDDQVDPYHGQQEPQPEPEALDLPDDLNLDGGDPGADNNEEKENPFDIDKMKEDDQEKIDENGDEDKEGDQEEDNMETDGKVDDGVEKEEAVDKDKDIEMAENDESSEESGGEENGEKETVDKNPEDEEESAQNTPQDEAAPSLDTPAHVEAQPAADQSDKGAKDRTAQKEEPMETDQSGQNEEADNEDNEGVGMAESRESKGHEGQESSTAHRSVTEIKEDETRGKERPKKPGKSDPERALGSREKDKFLQVHAKDSNKPSEKEGVEDSEEKQVSRQDIFEHVKGVDEKYDAVTKDAATEDQAKEQPVADQEKEDQAEDKDDVQMKENDIDEEEEKPVEEKEAEKTSTKSRRHRGDVDDKLVDDMEQLEDQEMQVEGDTVATTSVSRGNESSYVTQVDLLKDAMQPGDVTIESLRLDVEQRLATWTAQPEAKEGEETWRQLETITYGLAQDLCEQLRLILEPSQASRLRGDYRTGKRINMRKVIPYIASQFRKDRIWLRRTKPAKRSYQIVLAVDDSSSMADNRSKELAFESLALMSKALSLLEAGQLGVVSFGEDVNLLHNLDEPFSDNSGARVLQQFTFAQKKTRIAHMVDFVTGLLSHSRTANSDSETAQLLLIVSDGRGLFSEGSDAVQQAIRRARQARVFMVFVIIDNPESKDSILDIRMPIFGGPGKLMEIKPYLDCFPFPFYVILRNIQALPVVLSDALRQWFELVTCSSS